MTTTQAQLLEAARAFRDDDPDPATRAEADAWIARAAAGSGEVWAELEERFGRELTFGTAGLRGLLGAGQSRMNRRIVARTTAALCAYLEEHVPNAKARGMSVGYDGRHQSREFAEEVAEIAWGAGFVVHLFEHVVPTPLVAFSVLDRAAASGVVITASHNPAQYNGYKVYLDDGAQLGTPADRDIEKKRDQLAATSALRRRTRQEASDAGLIGDTQGIADRYVARVAAAVGRGVSTGAGGESVHAGSGASAGAGTSGGTTLPLRAAYTAMHGVGEALARRVFGAIGAVDVASVAEQAIPNPDFPTVAFPNPEEPGALDRVLALGELVGADIAIANDPDADRLALAARVSTRRESARDGDRAEDPSRANSATKYAGDSNVPVAASSARSAHSDARPTASLSPEGSSDAESRAPALAADGGATTTHGRSTMASVSRVDLERLEPLAPGTSVPKRPPLVALSGNEVGVLLADHLLSLAPRDGRNVVVSTIVSTPLLERVVHSHGARCVRTLTGFKWIIAQGLQLSRDDGLRFVLGFEEALGYCIGDLVRDKDGIAAAAHALHMAEIHARAGRTLHDALEAMYLRHGLCHSSQVSFTRAGTAGIAEIRAAMSRLRSNPPPELASLRVVAMLDLAQSPEARQNAGSALFDATALPSSDVVALALEGDHRITVRPSGTEPKLKLYLDVWTKLENRAELPRARAEAQALAAQLAAAIADRLGF